MKDRKENRDRTAKKRRRVGGYTGVRIRAALIFAFAAVYILSMFLATWVAQLGRRNDFAARTAQMEDSIWDQIRTDAREWDGNERDMLYAVLSSSALIHSTEYQSVSAAAYDADGALAAQSASLMTSGITDGDRTYLKSWDLTEYLSEAQLEELARCDAENYETHDYAGVTYQISAGYTEQGRNLSYICARRLFYSTEDARNATDAEKMQTWEIEGADHTGAERGTDDVQIALCDLWLPGMESGGTEGWHAWMENGYLHGYPEQRTQWKIGWQKEDGFTLKTEDSFVCADEKSGRPVYTIAVRSVEQPWKAAFDSMTHIYLWGAVLTIACAVFVLVMTEKVSRKKALLEERQKDFVNAIAHEMKTPLAVVRGFAENLEEDVNEEKRRYYLQQIVAQTEEMDGMVKEMIFLAGLEPGQYRPVKERVSVRELLREITAAKEEQMEEKRIELSVRCGEDFIVEAEERFLEKAFANLIENAVSYSRDEGTVTVSIERDRCVIENTGGHIPEEDLPRVCELFYTGEKSRGGREKHLGIGLYLADRIFRAHDMSMKIENTGSGVRVTVRSRR